MRLRPCIDIHNGKVKQIVGGSLTDTGDTASENFVSEQDAAFFARKYKADGMRGGHIILLNGKDSPYYEATKRQALSALSAWPQGMQAGGGITPDNAQEFLAAGASHVIVTSYVFSDGRINRDHLEKMTQAVGRKRLVLDLSCRKKGEDYYIVTDRWQKFTDTVVTPQLLRELTVYCDEYLVHAVDVEGRVSGIETGLVEILATLQGFPVTYAGGVARDEDLEELRILGQGKIDVTIGSALDIFGGTMSYERLVRTLHS